MPFPAHLTYCYSCRKQKVPDVLFTTIDLPRDALVIGKGCLIQARLCRLKKKSQAEANATVISSLLPFMEYELHTQLMNKLKLKGMNALFGLRIQITVGESMLLGLASATGVYLSALPTPGGIQISGKTPSDGSNEQHMSHMQKKINETIAKNKELYEINPPEILEETVGSPIPEPRQRSRLLRSQSESSDETAELDLSHGKKDAFVLERMASASDRCVASDQRCDITRQFYLLPYLCRIRFVTARWIATKSLVESYPKSQQSAFNPMAAIMIDDTDAMEDVHSLLTDVAPPPGFFICNTEIMPGINNWIPNIQVISADAEEQLQFPMELSSDSPGPQPFSPARDNHERGGSPATQRAADYGSFADRCNSWIEHIRVRAHTIRRGSVKTTVSQDKSSPLTEGPMRHRGGTAGSIPSVTVVKMTPLSFIPGAKITKFLGIINMFFIRETTSLREEGGVSGFLHAFICEVFAMVRAHVAALGGNAVVSYIMKQCVFMENANKNQAQCLINVSGDAVIFISESELDAAPAPPTAPPTAPPAQSVGGDCAT
ncbi:hypothetical protein XELAEV_18016609mg [Xenopus laevis]|uniref:C2 domain-containing protein 5 n=1 Tax=Xenopus laevis TaxID=8355 RepID=A0A974HRU1_XENLA|nr:hypothetical protein XELAEV_18016609mg [Xenopus laevis]